MSAFRREVENRGDNWVMVGYVRKSKTNETAETRTRFLQLMIDKLRNRCFCGRVYVSPCTSASMPILDRDFEMPDQSAQILKGLVGCDGNTQEMLHFLTHTTKRVQLCVISYAGLSNEPDDVERFLRACKMVKVMTIDHQTEIESIDRFNLLHGTKEKPKKLKSDSGCVKRFE